MYVICLLFLDDPNPKSAVTISPRTSHLRSQLFEPGSLAVMPNQLADAAATHTIQRLVENAQLDAQKIEVLTAERDHLVDTVGELHAQSMDREHILKHENDVLLVKVRDALAKDARTEAERDALKRLFVSRQQEFSEALINQQSNVIESLQMKCANYEKGVMGGSRSLNGKYKNCIRENVECLT